MKKNLFLLLTALFCVHLSAEEKVSEYYLSYFDKVYEIEASFPKNGKFTYYIYCPSKESSHNQCGFYIESKELETFISCLRSIEPKFEEWSATAMSNRVTNYDKDFDVNFKRVGTFFLYGSKWCFSGTKFAPYFRVTEKGDCLVVFNVGKMTASSNQFMHHKGFMIAFKSIKEIEDFISALSPDNVLKKEEERANKDELFK